MAKRRKSKSRRRFSGKGRYCVTITAPKGSKVSGKVRGGLKFSTRCYSSKDAAVSGMERRLGSGRKFYTAMIHPRGRGR